MIGIKLCKLKIDKLCIEYCNFHFRAEETSEDEARVRAKREECDVVHDEEKLVIDSTLWLQ